MTPPLEVVPRRRFLLLLIVVLPLGGCDVILDLLHNAADHSALKRNVTPEDVANASAFLASSLSSGITGQTLFVDGGYNIWG